MRAVPPSASTTSLSHSRRYSATPVTLNPRRAPPRGTGTGPRRLSIRLTLHVVATAVGGPEVLALVDEPDRSPGPGEVVLDVRAAGVNPVDFKRYAGRM